eukprot:948067_1
MIVVRQLSAPEQVNSKLFPSIGAYITLSDNEYVAVEDIDKYEANQPKNTHQSSRNVQVVQPPRHTVATDEDTDEEESTFAIDIEQSKQPSRILERRKVKRQSLNICLETDPINFDGTDSGLITFFEHYVSSQYVNQIFKKCDVEYISNVKELTKILILCLLIYKVKVFQIQNTMDDGQRRTDKMRIQKEDFEPIATYLSHWIIREYGQVMDENEDQYERYDITITKESFASNMYCYLKKFVSGSGA